MIIYLYEWLINFVENNNGFIKSIIFSNLILGVFLESVFFYFKYVV